MITLAYGTLPTPSFFNIACRRAGTSAPGELLKHLRDMLNRHGPCPYVQASLQVLGFRWESAPVLPEADLQEDIDAVAAALGDES